MKIIVTGSKGQLGQELQHCARSGQEKWCFTDANQLDITKPAEITQFFAAEKPDWCINAAAYTAVDQAEKESEKAFAVNATGVANLGHVAEQHNCPVLHVSTDFVFGNQYNQPIQEADQINPLGVYGSSKAEGEKMLRQVQPEHIIVRTSWLYSSFGKNFVKTMLRLADQKPELRVVSDQIGSPTYARDLAEAILALIRSQKTAWGTYHYANSGAISWYDLAQQSLYLAGKKTPIHAISTSEFPTPAERPKYSVLDTQKIRQTFGLKIPQWQESLERCIRAL